MKGASKIFRLRFFRFRAALIFAAGAVPVLSALLWWATARDLKDPPRPLTAVFGGVEKLRVLDRFGNPLSTTYKNSYNVHDYAYLHEIPQLLQQAFIMAEDRRFYSHRGADRAARAVADPCRRRALSIAPVHFRNLRSDRKSVV